MKYNPSKSFDKQTDKVKEYIRHEIIDICNTKPKTEDYLSRPLTFEFTFEDETNTQYLITTTNHYIDNRSWRLDHTQIEVTPITTK